jgi:hypothetical protein
MSVQQTEGQSDMEVMLWITTGVLVVAMGGIGAMKLVGNEEGIEQAVRLGYEHIRIPIGVAEVLAAAGVIIGAVADDFQWLGAAAALGVIAMMIGAAIFHLRVRDKFEMAPSIVVMIVAILYLIALNAN